jgi:hypothetical protein
VWTDECEIHTGGGALGETYQITLFGARSYHCWPYSCKVLLGSIRPEEDALPLGRCRIRVAERRLGKEPGNFRGGSSGSCHSKNAVCGYGLPACPIMDYRADQQTQLGITNPFAEELSDAPGLVVVAKSQSNDSAVALSALGNT